MYQFIQPGWFLFYASGSVFLALSLLPRSIHSSQNSMPIEISMGENDSRIISLINPDSKYFTPNQIPTGTVTSAIDAIGRFHRLKVMLSALCHSDN